MNPSRRLADNGSLPFSGALHQKPRTSPLLPIGLVVLVFIFFMHFEILSCSFDWCLGSLLIDLVVFWTFSRVPFF